ILRGVRQQQDEPGRFSICSRQAAVVLGFVLCLVACVGLAFDPSQRIALWCGIPFVALCYGAWYLTRSRNMTQEPQHVAD
ncbi:hypothetical protein ACR93M_06070, partial [Klebsiella pneumoniae]